jgi:glycosidase
LKPSRCYSAAWQDQILYVLIPHKFFDGDPSNNIMKDRFHLPNARYEGGFLGGDLAGVRQKVSYVKGLGVTGVLFYPMMRNDAEPLGRYLAPGYRPSDYHAVDPNFGTVKDLQAVVAALHSTAYGAPRLNALLDLPLGMTGLEHPWNKRPSDYPDYYRPWNARDPTQNVGRSPMHLVYGDVDNAYGMPIINHVHGMENGSGTYAALRDTLYYLADTFDVDGFRYDSAQNVDPRFWVKALREFRAHYASMRPNFMHLAEVFIGNPKKDWQVYQDDFMDRNIHTDIGYIGMDGTYDFGLISEIQNVFAKGQDVGRLVRHGESQTAYFEHPERLAASIDNYEADSFNRKVVGGDASAKSSLALAFLLTIDRVPLIYSGNEYGIDYDRPGQLFAPSFSSTAYLDHFKRLICVRRDHPAFRCGTMRWLDRTRTFLSFERTYQDRRYVVALNNSASPQEIAVRLGVRGIRARGMTAVLNSASARLEHPGSNDASLTIRLGAFETMIVETR